MEKKNINSNPKKKNLTQKISKNKVRNFGGILEIAPQMSLG
jgi:hypothetical protein